LVVLSETFLLGCPFLGIFKRSAIMKTISIGLVAYFEDRFLRGLFELEYQKNYQVCHVTLGREPKDEETLDFLKFFPN